MGGIWMPSHPDDLIVGSLYMVEFRYNGRLFGFTSLEFEGMYVHEKILMLLFHYEGKPYEIAWKRIDYIERLEDVEL